MQGVSDLTRDELAISRAKAPAQICVDRLASPRPGATTWPLVPTTVARHGPPTSMAGLLWLVTLLGTTAPVNSGRPGFARGGASAARPLLVTVPTQPPPRLAWFTERDTGWYVNSVMPAEMSLLPSTPHAAALPEGVPRGGSGQGHVLALSVPDNSSYVTPYTRAVRTGREDAEAHLPPLLLGDVLLSRVRIVQAGAPLQLLLGLRMLQSGHVPNAHNTTQCWLVAPRSGAPAGQMESTWRAASLPRGRYDMWSWFPPAPFSDMCAAGTGGVGDALHLFRKWAVTMVGLRLSGPTSGEEDKGGEMPVPPLHAQLSAFLWAFREEEGGAEGEETHSGPLRSRRKSTEFRFAAA